jgi:hypothetical protein
VGGSGLSEGGGQGKEKDDETGEGRCERESRALINWTFRGYLTGQVTTTPVWLNNSVFT